MASHSPGGSWASPEKCAESERVPEARAGVCAGPPTPQAERPPGPFFSSVLISTFFLFTDHPVIYLLFNVVLVEGGLEKASCLLQVPGHTCAMRLGSLVPTPPLLATPREDSNPLSTSSAPAMSPRTDESAEMLPSAPGPAPPSSHALCPPNLALPPSLPA